jgi:hypothetical protein
MKNKDNEKLPEKEYKPPKIVEKKDLEVDLFSDEPNPWGP